MRAAFFCQGCVANGRQIARIGIGKEASPRSWTACAASIIGLRRDPPDTASAAYTKPPEVHSSAHSANIRFAIGEPGKFNARRVRASNRTASSSPVVNMIRSPAKKEPEMTTVCKSP